MIYKSFRDFEADMEYLKEIRDSNHNTHDHYMYSQRNSRYSYFLEKEWQAYMQECFEVTKNTKGKFASFLKEFNLSFKELKVLTELIRDEDDVVFDLFNPERKKADPVRRNRLSFNRSQLKKQKLVFLITDPKKPLEENYVVSYKAKVLIQGKKYTEEYQILDFELEERSVRKDTDLLESLYYVVKPKQKLSDLIASKDLHRKLQNAISRTNTQEQLMAKWKLGRHIPYGTGIAINFRGDPGTGKTMAAHCLAKELNKKLLIVRYDQVQSKWVGETEKHIQQVFKLAKTKKAVLFFDEADALAHDRSTLEKSWEMSQVNTLLKELERYDGVCIFATNFAEKYDKAFERRLTMHIDFPKPAKEEAATILHKLLPPRMRHEDLDLANLNLEGFTGGILKNVVLNAMGYAAQEGLEKVKHEHLVEALGTVQASESKVFSEKNELSYIG